MNALGKPVHAKVTPVTPVTPFFFDIIGNKTMFLKKDHDFAVRASN
jgi:hypothetical protein